MSINQSRNGGNEEITLLYMLGTLAMDTTPFNVDGMDRKASASIVSKGVMGTLPPKEFTGEGDDQVTLSGQLLPTKIGGLNELDIADEMRRSGTRFPLQRGDGKRFGWYAITNISEKHKHLMRDGVGFVVKYTIKMTKVQSDSGAGQQIIFGLLSMFSLLR